MSFWDPVTLKDGVRWLSVISCILSFFGALFIIIAYWRFPSLRKPARYLLLWLSMADLGTALIIVITIICCYDCTHCSDHVKLLCAIIGVFCPVASFLWTDCIAIYIFGASYQKTWINPTSRLFFVFHMVSWTIPLILVLIIVIMYVAQHDDIQFSSHYTGGWCWVNTLSLQLIGGKIVEIFSYIFLFIIYFATWIRLKKIKKIKKMELTSKSSHAPDGIYGVYKINELLTRLTLIPLIFVILRSFGTLRVILIAMNAIPPNGIIDNCLLIGQAFCDPLQGFCNALLFLLCVSAVRETIFNVQEHVTEYRESTLTPILTTNTPQTETNEMKETVTKTNIVFHNKFNPLL